MESSQRPLGACAATVALLESDTSRLTVFHSGDTRAAHVRDGHCRILTPLDQGAEGELRCYFGTPVPSHTSISLGIEAGDRIVIAGDGATKSLNMSEIAGLLEKHPSRQSGLQALARSLSQRPSGDDVTVVVVDVGDE